MKKLLMLFVLAAVLSGPLAFADDSLVGIPNEITVKQGMLVKWDNPEGGVKNLSTVTIAKTRASDSFGRWNALWDGWTLDAGFAYDAAGFNTGALLVGREFGALGKYVPIDFPLKDKLELTIYPFGVFAEDIFDHPSVHGASGVGIIKIGITF